jgi:hypothetical protein
MRRITVVLGLVLALLVACGVVGIAIAAVPTNTSALRNAVSVEGIMEHERAFQNIADLNGGTRIAPPPPPESGTSGYDASAAYVKKKLVDAGYTVTEQKFTYPFFQELTPTTFSRTDVTPPKSYVDGTGEGTDANPPGYFHIMSYSGSADVVDAPVVPTNDIQILPESPANTSSSGCEATDFEPASETEPQVALIQRGGGSPGCNFQTKALNAQDAGYAAAIIFNEGQEGRTEVIPGTLSGLHPDHPEETWIPVLMTSTAVGEELYNAYDPEAPDARVPRVSISTDTLVQPRETSNIIADYPGGRTDRTLIVGAHLDSVPEGPGINDNGSGSAGILEIALQMKELGINPTNDVRFAFWGAEEAGPPQWGSKYYVDHLGQLGQPQRKDIALYLNFDMIGSPNYVRFVYDGDGNAVGPPGPNGSGTIEKVFRDYFASQNLATEPTPFDGRSDYLAFLQAGIPAGGLISGADGIKTPQQAEDYGGTPGLPYDSCYHQACDTIDNLNEDSIDELADGAAHATLTFAQTTSAVKGTDKASKTNTAASKMEYQGPMAIK